MVRGVLLIISACFIWGLIYVVPLYMIGFNALEVAIGRYFTFGLTSLLYMLSFRRAVLRTIPRSTWIIAAYLALLANVGFYPLAVLCMRCTNASIAALILGMSPVTIALYANYKEKEINFSKLILPCSAMVVGLILVNIPSLHSSSHTGSVSTYLMGLSAGFITLFCWSFYAVLNGRYIKKHPSLNPIDWCSLTGIATLGWIVLLIPLYALWMGSEHMHKFLILTPELQNFLIGSLILGVACSWIAFSMWNKGSGLVPVSLAGQLTIFETLFGLLFIYLLERRYPADLELAGVAIMLSAIYISIRRFTVHPHVAMTRGR